MGVIDCTHIAITPPKKNDDTYPEHIYVNRKGYHSINTQLVSDILLVIYFILSNFNPEFLKLFDLGVLIWKRL